MEKRHMFILGAFLMIIVVSESGVVSRNVPRDGPSGNGELPRTFNRGQDKKWRPGFGIGEDFGSNEFETGVIDPHIFPAGDDYGQPGEGDNRVNEVKPERVPSDEGGSDDKDTPEDDKDEEDGKPEDKGFLETSDGEEDSDESMDNDKDSAPPADEDEEDKPRDKDEGDEKIPKEKDVGPEGEPEENDDDDDDQKEDEPVDEEDKDNKAVDGGWGSGLFNIFNTPSFNFNLIREYSDQLEKAFRQLFRQTADKALQMNGTFTNTTEEEVEIGGKKYLVQKSIIKGGDNESSIYIETLSSKKRRNETEEIQNNIMGNIERQM